MQQHGDPLRQEEVARRRLSSRESTLAVQGPGTSVYAHDCRTKVSGFSD
jgi:hypothetical protein